MGFAAAAINPGESLFEPADASASGLGKLARFQVCGSHDCKVMGHVCYPPLCGTTRWLLDKVASSVLGLRKGKKKKLQQQLN